MSECPVPGIPGAIIKRAILPAHLPGARRTATDTEYLADTVFFTIPGVARYRVRDGNVVEVHALEGADPAAVRLFARNTARGALIHQRHEFPLEGCALSNPGGFGVVVLCGPSGIGKSTLAAALTGRGWRLMSDGITRVTLEPREAVAWPSASAVKLWRDGCDRLGIDTNDLPKVREGADRFYVDVPAETPSPKAVTAIVSMSIAAATSIEEEILTPAQRHDFIAEHVFKPRHAALLGHPNSFEPILARLAQTARTYHLQGARSRPVHELADAVVGTLG